jgi:hypothetical protein
VAVVPDCSNLWRAVLDAVILTSAALPSMRRPGCSTKASSPIKISTYRDWSIVYLKYCDGTGHQGYKKDPILYKGKNLYFRGHNVTMAQLNSLYSLYGLFSATGITGQSAGGLATFLWTNYIVDRAPKTTRVISQAAAATRGVARQWLYRGSLCGSTWGGTKERMIFVCRNERGKVESQINKHKL